MLSRARRWIPEVPLLVLTFVVLLAGTALARIGGGEHFDSGNSSSDSGGDWRFLIDILVWLVIEYPQVGVPVLIIVVIGVVVHHHTKAGDSSTRKAIDRAEAQRRTAVSANAVQGWVSALKQRDPGFELLPFLDRVKREFLELQDAWFKRELEPVRRYLSDATYQRLMVQLELMRLMGVRDAIAEPQVLDLGFIGLEQSNHFDSVHVRVTASLRDDDAPASATDAQARALAMKRAPERFTEVWTFVRKPGAQTKPEADVSQGKCPNCGAPFSGGAANTCEFCGAIVNSGHYDWVLAEITQGSEYAPSHEQASGLAQQRQRDPEFTTEVLEDRASLLFWKWVQAQAKADPGALAKVAAEPFLAEVAQGVAGLTAQGRRKFFLECAVGGVATRRLHQEDGFDVAAVEVRWSAKIGLGPQGGKPPGNLPSQPQRYVMLLQRKAGAHSSEKNGMSTNRCPGCNAPLTDNGQPTCEFCGAQLAGGEHDWVLRDFGGWEWWLGQVGPTMAAQMTAPFSGAPAVSHAGARVPDRQERERLVYLMAAMAKADGVVDAQELQLLRMASERWSVPWANVELALNAGDGLFVKLVAKGSQEAEAVMRELVAVALVDGKVDHKERKLLNTAAAHLGFMGRLDEFLRR